MSGRRTKQARRKEPFATTMLPPQPCPVCGAKLDCASGWEGQEPRIGTDFTVCLYCSTVLKIDQPYRQASLDELADVNLKELGRALRLAKEFQAWCKRETDRHN